MSWLGLMPKFKKNRPLTALEIENRLDIKKSVGTIPNHGVSVIKMNSTYMDTVDKFYAWKGQLTAPILFLAVPFLGGWSIVFLYLSISTSNIEWLAFALFLCWLPLVGCLWITFRECFKYTHYPIRFNRKNRMVYVFRLDGSILKAPWNKLHFNLARGLRGTGEWEIHAHVLSEDRTTVLETFGFAVATVFKDYTINHWEFIRRYMEEGPESCYFDRNKKYLPEELTPRYLTFCNDVDGKRESTQFSHQRIKLNYYGNAVYYYFCYPLIKALVLCRILAMKSCKVPQWPADVEAESPVAVDDPYITTAENNVKITLFYGEVPVVLKEEKDNPQYNEKKNNDISQSRIKKKKYRKQAKFR